MQSAKCKVQMKCDYHCYYHHYYYYYYYYYHSVDLGPSTVLNIRLCSPQCDFRIVRSVCDDDDTTTTATTAATTSTLRLLLLLLLLLSPRPVIALAHAIVGPRLWARVPSYQAQSLDDPQQMLYPFKLRAIVLTRCSISESVRAGKCNRTFLGFKALLMSNPLETAWSRTFGPSTTGEMFYF